MRSALLSPAARTRTSSSPLPGSGSGCSRISIWLSTIVTAFIGSTVGVRFAVMRVALTIGDFLQRADAVYGDRIGLIDEPAPPGGSWGSLTWHQVHERARGQAAAFDRLGVGRGERVAIVSPNAARFFTSFFGVSGFGRILVPINFRLNAQEISYIVDHSGASVLLVDPELDEALATVDAKHRFVLGSSTDAELFSSDAEPEPSTETEEAA